MREHQDVHRVIGDPCQGLVHTPVNIYRVSDLLEGEEGYPDRQRYGGPPGGLHTDLFQDTVQVFNEEIGIFEIGQQANVQENRNPGQPPFLLSLRTGDMLHKVKVDDNGSQHDKDEIGRAPGIENDTGEQHPGVFKQPGQQVVDDQEDRQENDQEQGAAENHGANLRFYSRPAVMSFIIHG